MLYPFAIRYSPLLQRRHSIDIVSKELSIDINIITETNVDAYLLFVFLISFLRDSFSLNFFLLVIFCIYILNFSLDLMDLLIGRMNILVIFPQLTLLSYILIRLFIPSV